MTTTKIPRFTKALTIKPAATKLKNVYHEAVLEEKPFPMLKGGEVLVKVGAATFNSLGFKVQGFEPSLGHH